MGLGGSTSTDLTTNQLHKNLVSFAIHQLAPRVETVNRSWGGGGSKTGQKGSGRRCTCTCMRPHHLDGGGSPGRAQHVEMKTQPSVQRRPSKTLPAEQHRPPHLHPHLSLSPNRKSIGLRFKGISCPPANTRNHVGRSSKQAQKYIQTISGS